MPKDKGAFEGSARLIKDTSPDGAHATVEYSSIGNSEHIEPPRVNTTNLFIYISHFLTKWAERMWTFAVGLFMVDIAPNSLQLTAIYGLSMGACVLLLGPVVGDWVDNVPRLKAARITLILQRVFVVLCSAVIYCFLEFRDTILGFGEWTRYVTYALIIIFAAASLLSNTANTISVEKDWIVKMCAADQDKLATMTARMRGIDLTTQILAPVATGQIMTFIGVDYGAIFIAGWNVVTVVIEYYLIWKVYKTIPALKEYKDVSKTIGGKNRSAASNGTVTAENGEIEVIDNPSCLKRCRIFAALFIIIEGWKTFARYEVMLSGLALACLYMTVLGFGNVTVGYAKLQGLSDSVVGVMMGGAGLIGIIGTFAYPFFRRKMGLPRSGMVALMIQWTCLSPCVVSIWLPGSPFDPTASTTNPSSSNSTTSGTFINTDNSLVSIIVLMSGIVTARFGLWIADLSITQMFMQTVKEEERGVVFGVQTAINRLMDMLKFGVVTALPLTPQFGFLIIISFGFVLLGVLLYAIFFCRVPSALFPKKSSKPGYTRIR